MPLVVHAHHERLPGLPAEPDRVVDAPEISLVGSERVSVEPRRLPVQVDVRGRRVSFHCVTANT
jgi:hypothetical protein